MSNFEFSTNQAVDASAKPGADSLFMWRGAEIILIGALEEGRWVLARGWLAADRLEHVRRWSFSQPIPFSGQVRRLVMEAHGDFTRAREEGSRALGWAESLI